MSGRGREADYRGGEGPPRARHAAGPSAPPTSLHLLHGRPWSEALRGPARQGGRGRNPRAVGGGEEAVAMRGPGKSRVEEEDAVCPAQGTQDK